MEDLSDLIEVFKDRERDLRMEAEVNAYLESEDSENIEFCADENLLVAALLEDFNKVLSYDEVCMYCKFDNIGFKQITKLKLPLEESISILLVSDLNSKRQIDTIQLKKPLDRKELKSFAESYMKRIM